MTGEPADTGIEYGPDDDFTDLREGDPIRAIERCPSCGGDAGDRSLCAEPCGSMHTRCRECGHALDGCRWEQEEDPDGSIARYGYTREDALSADA